MHRGPITSVVVSKEGRYVYTGGYDKNIYRWDRQQGTSERLGAHQHLVNALALSEGGRWLASSSSDYTLHLYDLEKGERQQVLYGHNDDAEGLTFVDGDSKLISVSRDHRALVWDLQTGRILTEFRGHSKDVLSVWAYRDRVFTTGDDGRCLVWKWADGTLCAEIGPFEYELDAVGGHGGVGLFAIGGDDGRVLIYLAEELTLHTTLQAHERGVKRVVFSPSGRWLLTAGYDHRIKIWDVKTGKLAKELPAFRYQWERTLAWTPDEQQVLSGSFGNVYAEWDVEQERLLSVGRELASPSINDIAIGPDLILTASDDGKFRIQGVAVNAEGGVLTNGVAISEDGRFALWGDHAGNVSLVDVKHGDVACAVETGTGPINTIFYDAMQHAFYVGTYGGAVHRFDLATRSFGQSWQAHQGAVKALAVNDQHVVTCSSDGSIHAYDRTDPTRRTEFFGPTAIVNDISLHPNGRQLVTVGRDKVVRLYEIDSQKIVAQHLTHRYSVKSVAIALDGTIYAGDYWGYVSIWHPDREEQPLVVRVGQNGISALRAAGDQVYASSYDGCVYTVSKEGIVQEALRLFNQSEEGVEC